MDTVIVTVGNSENEQLDLEVPVDVPVSVLAPAITSKLGWDSLYPSAAHDNEYAFDVAGLVLRGHETLGSAGIVNGDLLLITTIRAVMAQPAEQEKAPEIDRVLPYSASLVSETGQHFRLGTKHVIVGRSDRVRVDVDLTYLDVNKASSRQHAQIVGRESEYEIRDLNSLNGTYVNGRRLAPGERHPLKGGDQIQFGKGGAILRFQLG